MRAEAYAESIRPIVQEIKAAPVTTVRWIAQCLNARGFKTPNGKAFKPQSVKNLMERVTVVSAASLIDIPKLKVNITPAKQSGS